MSALPTPQGNLPVPMLVTDIDEVVQIEVQSYSMPWSRGNFVDSLAAGHFGRVLRGADASLLGYCIAMAGVDEIHLLNITVAPEHQGQGHALSLLEATCDEGRRQHAQQLWLEVRVSNARARSIYQRRGFREVGLRRNYYPLPGGAREDAVLMSLVL